MVKSVLRNNPNNPFLWERTTTVNEAAKKHSFFPSQTTLIYEGHKPDKKWITYNKEIAH